MCTPLTHRLDLRISYSKDFESHDVCTPINPHPRARAGAGARRSRRVVVRPPPFRDAKLCRRTRNMARGLKKHLKRLNAPKHWMLDKLGGVFAPKPSPGAMRRAQRVFIE